MTNSSKIADRLIAESRGILTPNRWKEAADIITLPVPVPHVMPIKNYCVLVGAQQRNDDEQ